MKLQSSFTIIPMAVSLASDASGTTNEPTIKGEDKKCKSSSASVQMNFSCTAAQVAGHYELISGSDVRRCPPRFSRMFDSRKDQPSSHSNYTCFTSEQTKQGHGLIVNVSCEHLRASEFDYKNYNDDDNSTIATEQSLDSPSPLSTIQFPGGRLVNDLTKEEWRNLYLSSQQATKEMHRTNDHVSHENRILKRQIIQLQKQVNETRRNNTVASRTTEPWTIPDLPTLKRRRVSLEQNVTYCD